ncbi:response regulator [Pseudomonas aeruginosa]|nr:response regulator [Pseudomonas aeruginosa]
MDVCSASTALPVRSRNVSLRICTPSARSVRLLGRRRRENLRLLEALPAIRDGHGKTRTQALVAEDNPFNQQLLKEQLEELGCTVCLCQDGREALQAWLSGRFDVLLTDVNMPVMNGYELAVEVRALDPLMLIIGVTANAMKEEGERCVAVGMNTWMGQASQLADAIRRTLQGLQDLPSRSGSGWLRASGQPGANGEDQVVDVEGPRRGH